MASPRLNDRAVNSLYLMRCALATEKKTSYFPQNPNMSKYDCTLDYMGTFVDSFRVSYSHADSFD